MASREKKGNRPYGRPAIEVPDPQASIPIIPAKDGLLPPAHLLQQGDRGPSTLLISSS